MEKQRLSSGAQERQDTHAELRQQLTRELREFTGLGASFYRSAADHVGMTVADVQVIEMLGSAGPATAGQLADLTGLTTGSMTALLNRLETAGIVRRERDPNDGRRVIVQLARDVTGKDGADERQAILAIFASVGTAWDALAAHYDDEQVALLLAFLKRSNAISRQAIVQLREPPKSKGDAFAAPLGDLKSGRLVVASGTARLAVRAGVEMADLYAARFEGTTPTVKVLEKDHEGVVTIRYPRRLLGLGGKVGAAEIALSPAIPWQIALQGGAEELVAELGSLDLAGLEIMGGFQQIRLALPTPSGMVTIRIRGGASAITIQRPVGVAVRVHLQGWAAEVNFDGQILIGVGANAQLQSAGYAANAPRYDIDMTSYANSVTITAV